ncbi:MAG: ATP-grasp domain-containing protein [bacterium]
MNNQPLQQRSVPIFFICNDPLWAIGLEKTLPNYHIICIDDKEIVDLLQNNGVNVFCLERELNNKNVVIRNTAKLLQHPLVETYIQQQAKGNQPHILPFRPSASLQKFCENKHWKLLAADFELNLLFEDKLSFSAFLEKNDLPATPHFIEPLIATTYEKAVKIFNTPFIIQLPHGFAGSSTFLVNNQAEFDHILKENENKKAKISQFIEGIPFTINACSTEHGTIYAPLCHQITGYLDYTTSWGGTCGTTWQFSELPRTISETIYKHTETIGNLMYKQGFKGIFGLDFVVNIEKETVYIIECNARIVASIPLFTEMQLIADNTPLLHYHILEHANEHYDLNPTTYNEKEKTTPYTTSQLILRNTTGKPQPITNPQTTGLYHFNNEKLSFLHPAYQLSTCKTPEDILIIPTGNNQLVNPAIEYARLRTTHPFLDTQWKLTPNIHHIAKSLKQTLIP